jgi:hypothetical protein
VSSFFADSSWFDMYVLRPLSHIHGNWELSWDPLTKTYRAEEDSFAALVNDLIAELDICPLSGRYHDNEDRLAEYVRENLKWKITKVGGRWIGADYDSILSQGGFDDIDQQELVKAAAGRIAAAKARGQRHFDRMEESHLRMLAAVLTIILYHRADLG